MEKVAEKLKKSLECPVCLSLPESTPIYQCENGHIICKSCHQSLQICPQCRRPLGNYRNLTAESFLEAFSKPCCFARHGCEAMIPEDYMEDHKKRCAYRELSCPVDYCRNTVNLKNVINHLKEVHEKRVTTLGKNGFTYTMVNIDTVQCYSFDGRDFIAMMTIVRRTGQRHFWIYGVGTQEEFVNYVHSIQLTSHDGSSQLNSQAPVISLTKASKDILRDGDGLIMADQCMTSLRKSGTIKTKITIDKK